MLVVLDNCLYLIYKYTMYVKMLTWAVLSAKSITGGYAGINRRLVINSEGGYSALGAIEFKMKIEWV